MGEDQYDLFIRRKTHNEIYDDRVCKYTLNVPLEQYEFVTLYCKKKKMDRSILFREALDEKIEKIKKSLEQSERQIGFATGSTRDNRGIFNEKQHGFFNSKSVLNFLRR